METARNILPGNVGTKQVYAGMTEGEPRPVQYERIAPGGVSGWSVTADSNCLDRSDVLAAEAQPDQARRDAAEKGKGAECADD